MVVPLREKKAEEQAIIKHKGYPCVYFVKWIYVLREGESYNYSFWLLDSVADFSSTSLQRAKYKSSSCSKDSICCQSITWF